jgi:hypothetical protein
MKRTTRWSPDTCECVIEFDWDDTVNENDRVHTVCNIVKICDAHKKYEGDMEAHYNSILSENVKKNMTYAKILHDMPEICIEKMQNGNIIRELKPDKGFIWSFDSDRKLQIKLIGLTDEEKTNACSILGVEVI